MVEPISEIKGICHMHSVYSDGDNSLRELRDFYKERGLKFAIITDHADTFDHVKTEAYIKECAELSGDDFLIIPGLEVLYEGQHVLMIGIKGFVPLIKNKDEYLRNWASNASFVVLAHPGKSKITISKALEEVLHAIEIWNLSYDSSVLPNRYSIGLLRSLRKKGRKIFAFCGLDLHRFSHFRKMFIVVRGDIEKGKADILAKISKGEYFFEFGRIRLNADGSIIGVSDLKISLLSGVLVYFVLLMRGISRVSRKLKLPIPAAIKEEIRKKI